MYSKSTTKVPTGMRLPFPRQAPHLAPQDSTSSRPATQADSAGPGAFFHGLLLLLTLQEPLRSRPEAASLAARA